MNGELPSLDLAVVTHRPEGIERVAKMVLPPAEGITYVVSWQNHQDAPVPPQLAARPDVKIFRTDSKGISCNRNNALDHCEGDIILFSDDDLTYKPSDLEALRRLYKERPELEMVTLRCDCGYPEVYPTRETKLGSKLPKNYYVTSREISFRRTAASDLRCCPELGLGSPLLHCGEDEVFLLTAIHRGLDCRFVPLTICAHPHESTGTKSTVPNGVLLGFGCVIALQYPQTATLRIPLKAWRLWRAGKASLLKSLVSLTRGALMTPGLKKRNKKFLW